MDDITGYVLQPMSIMDQLVGLEKTLINEIMTFNTGNAEGGLQVAEVRPSQVDQALAADTRR